MTAVIDPMPGRFIVENEFARFIRSLPPETR